ncbi:MAG TPA: type IV toxin-antitoxin system AbiEi family antitoxin domain-containing protein, partial [Solirubrobacterales bacterium]|nr:type IV toxin-antitoxin system AbiEi family antitoxin domain-containing protein [Solirubrobacterales bacterium]
MVATRQLGPLGYTKSSVAKAAKAGRLHRLHRGVYVVGYRRLTWHGRCMAAVLASSPSVASHWSAGWLWGLLRTRPGTIHVTCSTSRRVRRRFVVHASDLADADRTVRDGIPVTSVARTILDLAADSHPKTVARFIERADDEKVFDLREMRGLLDRSKGHRGWSKVRAALDAYRP